MSAAAPSSVLVRRSPASALTRLFTSTIGVKVIMAVTGVVLSGFVLGHMAGNLTAFRGAETMDAYGASLRKIPALLWAVRAVLLLSVGLHIWAYLALLGRNMSARPQGYREVAHRESSFASRTMRWTGPLLAVFIVYHLLHLTTGTVHPSFHEGAVYGNLISGLQVAPVAIFYLVAVLALAWHLFHGVWSLFQTLGVSQPRYESLGRRFATVYTLVVIAGFAAIPIAVLARFLK